VELGLVAHEGTGLRSDPFRYWLPEREEHWRQTQFMYDHFQQVKKDLKVPFQSLRESRRLDQEAGRLDHLDARPEE
jgi:hypothetical protein